MKKLFSLLLVMVLITSVFATVGCNGLWGFDDDDDVVVPQGISFNIKAKLDLDPAKLSLRAAIQDDYDDFVANVLRASDSVAMFNEYMPVNADGTVTFSFLGDAGSYTVDIKHKDNANFNFKMFFNDAQNNNAEPYTVDVKTTAVAAMVSSDPTFDFTNTVVVEAKLADPSEPLAVFYDAFKTAYTGVINDTATVDTVAAPAIKMVESVSLDNTTLSLNKPATHQFVATLVPADPTIASLTWSSSDENVATIDANGLLTVVGGGVTTITVTTVSNQKTATCVVTVVVPVSGVTLDKATHSMPDGTTATLVATVAPADATNKTVTWTSSDATVATVSDAGLVTALKPGTTTITATSVADNTKSATCDITVTKVNVSSVSVKESTSLVVNAKETLVATVQPANATVKTVTWSSSNTAVAEVSSTGEVTAKAVGTANITVTSTDDTSKTDVCVVTVVAANVPVTGVNLNKTSLTLEAQAFETLLATVLPETATNKNVTWQSANEDVATVDASGKVTGVAQGTTTITVRTVDGNFSKTCTVNVTPRITEVATVTFDNEVTGIFDNMLKIEITGFPNTFSTSSTTVTLVNSSTRQVVKSVALSNASPGTIVLAINELGITPVAIESFQSLTFVPAIPRGATVKIKNSGTTPATYVATSNNIPAN